MKIEWFEQLIKGSENSEGTPAVQILMRSKESNTDNFNTFFGAMTENGKKAGFFPKESFDGNFYKEFKKEIKTRDLAVSDISGWYLGMR